MPSQTPGLSPDAPAGSLGGLSLDAIATLVGAICHTPFSAVRFVNDSRRAAGNAVFSAWDQSICRIAAASNETLFEVNDTTADTRFADSPFVVGPPGLRFYASAPMRTAAGEPLGVLCVMDTQPRTLDDQQRTALRLLADHIVGETELIRLRAEQERQDAAETRIERALQASESRARFLTEVADRTRDLVDPTDIVSAVSRLLGEYLGASRVAYAYVTEGDAFTILPDYTNGCATCAGDYVLDDFGPAASSAMRGGRTFVVRDVEKEIASDAGGATFLSIDICAIIVCPLVRAGRLVAMMAVHQTTPRDFSSDEVRLVHAVVERTWAYIERARATRERQEAFERLTLAQQAGRIGVFDWLIPENRVIWQPELEALYGLPPGSFEGNFADWRKRVVPEDLAKVEPQLQQALADKRAEVTYEFRITLPDGGLRWMNAAANFTYDVDGKPLRMIGVNYDSTAIHELADAREALLDSERSARGEVERVSRMKDEFLATLSHELRTPLNAILGWSQVLRIDPQLSADTAEGLSVIERNARSQAQIIEDLLDMSRIISGKLRLDVQRLDLGPVVQAAVETVRPAADARGVRLQVVIDPGTGPVSGDAGRLQQVLWNLLSNAIKFTPRAGRVQVLLQRVNSHIEISVSDTGQGIRPEFLPYVFDRFRQADASTTRHHGGLGIGLALVKQLVELHGGTVRAKSLGEGFGSTFVVMLPLMILHPEPHADADRRHPTATGLPMGLAQHACTTIRGVRVLVVDDEPDARGLVKRLLEDCEAEVTSVGSAAEAMIQLTDGGTFDVIVSDIGMPGEDGYGLMRRVRGLPDAQGGRTPAIALTAYARSEDRMRSVLAGFQMHVPKPVEPAELITMVASLAGHR